MNRASPIDLRRAMEVAQELTRAGIEFVCMPVLSDQDKAVLLAQQAGRLGKMLQEAIDKEKEPSQ
ncbi:DUF1382 family protein [Alcaligenes sp. WGS1538]|uniref:DUF1382 family protein n=1 Tax=Alcaligenes sp. WGS1538 TaxID=3366811 RepID=UPI00372D18BB